MKLRTLRHGFSVLATFIAAGAIAWPSTPESALPRFSRYERFVAMDGACGWPILVPMPDGKVACFIWPDASHGYVEGAIECWLSSDGGTTWQKTSTPVPHQPTMNRMNVAAGLTAKSDLIAVVGGWNMRKPAGWRPNPLEKASHGTFFADANTLDPIPAVSKDGGLTWSSYSPVISGQDNGYTPYGRIGSLPGGELGLMMYTDVAGFFTSGDDGRSWKRRSSVSEVSKAYNEIAWVVLENGELYAAARTGDDQRLVGLRSVDEGRSWTKERDLTLSMQHPADLTHLPDGRLLLSYGVRNEGGWGIWVRFADATAKFWSAPMMLVDLEGATDQRLDSHPQRDGGYPSTIVLEDGTLLTAYYNRGMPSHNRYHVGVVRWSLTPDGEMRFRPGPPK